MKRSMHGTWHSVIKKQLHRYCNEVTFRLNEGRQDNSPMERIEYLVQRAFRHRLAYRDLVR